MQHLTPVKEIRLAQSSRFKLSNATVASMHSYFGHCRSRLDSLILFEAACLGIIPRVSQRLSEKERGEITSGDIYIWDEYETGIKRWTDGKCWSTSRLSGPFLTYCELVSTPASNDGARPSRLCKQTTSVTLSENSKLHLIAYYNQEDVQLGRLLQPSMDPRLQEIAVIVNRKALINEPSRVSPPDTKNRNPTSFNRSRSITINTLPTISDTLHMADDCTIDGMWDAPLLTRYEGVAIDAAHEGYYQVGKRIGDKPNHDLPRATSEPPSFLVPRTVPTSSAGFHEDRRQLALLDKTLFAQ